jgi:hypothetical protein
MIDRSKIFIDRSTIYRDIRIIKFIFGLVPENGAGIVPVALGRQFMPVIAMCLRDDVGKSVTRGQQDVFPQAFWLPELFRRGRAAVRDENICDQMPLIRRKPGWEGDRKSPKPEDLPEAGLSIRHSMLRH